MTIQLCSISITHIHDYVFIFRPTFVHHFISRDTIEENIVNLFAADQLHDWEDITLSQLIKVFEQK